MEPIHLHRESHKNQQLYIGVISAQEIFHHHTQNCENKMGLNQKENDVIKNRKPQNKMHKYEISKKLAWSTYPQIITKTENQLKVHCIAKIQPKNKDHPGEIH